MENFLDSFLIGKEKIIVDKIPPVIFRSWNRCRELGVNCQEIKKEDILTISNLRELLDVNEDLIRAGQPVLKYIFTFLKNQRYLLVISNQEGYILVTLGDPSFLDRTKKIFLSPGVNWRENLRGTNGVGTVLIEHVPVTVLGWSHYAKPVHFLDCWAAPIYNPAGELTGVLNISGEAGASHEHLMEITVMAAKMIEQNLQIINLQRNFHFCRENCNQAGGSEEKYPWLGHSPGTRSMLSTVAKVARTNSTVLIQGESGTGKEVLARKIHEFSDRRNKPFIALNCSAIPDNLVESELYGYADGAFTGARRGGQSGKFELADQGTIFLDEIGDMPLKAQAALLRILQQRELTRIGEGRNRKIDVRVIAATNQDLSQLVEKKLFRLDLFYRLKVILIHIPPLRERLQDISDLVPYFVGKFCRELKRPILAVNPGLYDYLISYEWPGNVRQLENCIESMVVLASGPELLISDLPSEFTAQADGPGVNDKNTLFNESAKAERQIIVRVLAKTGGNVAAAARILGVGRATLYRKMKELNIKN